MRPFRILAVVLLALASGLMLSQPMVQAQTAPVFGALPVTQGRDCQTVRTCNFTRGAEVRGCLSSYTCRTCRMVPTRCSVGTAQGPCQRLQCSWGG